jgi:outer membrane lipopolysaccharide assembly protein LptE/RlpB
MKSFALLVTVAALTACGVETAGTAATSAEIKRRELEQHKKTLDQTQQRLEQSTQQLQKRAEQSSSEDK